MQFPSSLPVPDEVVEIASRLEEAGHEAWCVGGVVRDALLGIPLSPHSVFDLATSATPEEVMRLFPRTVPVGIKFGTVGVLDSRRRMHEVTTFRLDVSTDGRRAVVAYGATLEQDLGRRDFTINAIAYHPLRYEWRDPFEGAIDLARRRIRAVGDPTERFREDYLRILRCARFAARLGFIVDQATWEAAVEASPGLRGLSAERVRDEWYKSLETTKDLGRLAGLWSKIGAVDVWLPEMRGAEERQNIEVLQGLRDRDFPRDAVLLTALLCRDPAIVLHRLKASRAEIARAQVLQDGPAEPESDDSADVRRWLSRVGDAAKDFDELWRLRRGKAPSWRPVVDLIRSNGDPVTLKDLAIGGEDLMQAGMRPGPEMGRTLARLLDRVVEDPRLNSRDTLLALAKELP